MIKNIIFDLNKTLVKHKSGNNIKKYLETIGVDNELFKTVFNRHKPKHNIGKIKIDDFFSKIFEDLRLDNKFIEEVKNIYIEDFIVTKGIKGIIKKLRRNYKLFMLAGDGKEFLEKKIEKFDFKNIFHEIYATCHEGFLKKDPRLYRRLIKKGGINPKESLYIDDMPPYVEVARKLGFKTILFKDAKQLKEELKKFRINL